MTIWRDIDLSGKIDGRIVRGLAKADTPVTLFIEGWPPDWDVPQLITINGSDHALVYHVSYDGKRVRALVW